MGVPAFYRWLSEKYPKITTDVLEERHALSNPGSSSSFLPIDIIQPNPSNLETDNLYIDMNGIIHPCSHPENGPQPTSETEMYDNVCQYIDRLVNVVRPRRLLYLAIDGVAPRAKMNQQRARRFRAAQEAREHAELELQLRKEIPDDDLPDAKPDGPWDSNVITPGTTFMLRLSTYIRFYVRERLASNPGWKGLKVIFSDASIPGEGEHKIMDHVRRQRSQRGYDPNIVHVLHGLDADLIMLALATHEAHFYILREEVVFGRKNQDKLEQNRLASGFTEAQTALNTAVGDVAMELPMNNHKTLQRLSIPVLREYLFGEFREMLTTLPFCTEQTPLQKFERLVDDFIFLCFFVGNDFLPHLPSLDIRDGALDFLLNVYKRILPQLGEFITSDGGEVNLAAVNVVLGEVGAIEDYVFRMRHKSELRDKEYRKQFKQNPKGDPTKARAVSDGIVPTRRGRAARAMDGGAEFT
eukprot:CAMPEP_0194364840 /NCGR_PEP_ID=MMETSP0174-20130528/12788_1 /TAXON_ID=216777 /ORGANISM="Proboscia alata, Strain PI-D3" /LENGTH=468 /DNA_ID=CAMNT_0039139123 /DNA_START=209 /DNA_END=1611 /DNA_ORIENTATION=+